MKRVFSVLFVLILSVSASHAQSTKPVDARSEQVFSQSAWAYGSLSGMRVRFSTRSRGEKSTTTSGQFTFAAPNLLRLDRTVSGKSLRSLSNNAKLYEQVNAKTYAEEPAQPMPSAVTGVWRRVSPQAGALLGPLLLGQSPSGLFQYQKMTVRHRRSGGYDVIRASGRVDDALETWEMRFGTRDHLLYRLDWQSGRQSNRTIFSGYQNNPRFATGTFAFPSKGMKKIAASTPGGGQAPGQRFRVGSRPLPIYGVDLNGKRRSLADYKGKIVLVDFWATWCGPCIAELPNIQRAYRKYHSRGFEVLAVSLDDKKSDLTNFVRAHKLPWTQLYSGQGWKDPNARRYNVNGIPFALLIGPDGRILAVDVRGGELEKALEPLMKGWI